MIINLVSNFKREKAKYSTKPKLFWNINNSDRKTQKKISNEEVCKHNQSDYCKYKLNCKKQHENKLCPEEQICKSKGYILWHPKTCKYFFREGVCRFGDGCSYSHKKVSNQDPKMKDIIEKHEPEINAVKDEMKKLK